MKRAAFGKQFSFLGLVLIQIVFQACLCAEKQQHYTHEWAINVEGGEEAPVPDEFEVESEEEDEDYNSDDA